MAGLVQGCSYTRFKHRELEREFFRQAKDEMEIECIKNPGMLIFFMVKISGFNARIKTGIRSPDYKTRRYLRKTCVKDPRGHFDV